MVANLIVPTMHVQDEAVDYIILAPCIGKRQMRSENELLAVMSCILA